MAILKIFLHCLELLEFLVSPLATMTFCLSLLACLGWQSGDTLLPTILSALLVVLLTERQELEF
ncbi:MAG TPA: hypothetical protein V6D07_01530 [Trichocoleus sp.]